MILYEPFYKRYGVRTDSLLVTPPTPPIERFEFPKNSVHHYVTYDSVSNGPASDEYLYRSVDKKIFVEHVTELADLKGSPKRASVPLMPFIREFHNKNKRFRLTDDISHVNDENTLTVVNYALVSKAYRYVRSFYTEYFKWWNIQSTLWTHLKEATESSSRMHYVFVKLPVTLPSVDRLNQGAKVFNQNTLKNFPTMESLFLLELWKWMSVEHRAESVMGKLTTEQLKKINVVFQESGHWSMINMGLLDSWRYVKGVSPADQKVKIQPDQLQKRVLRSVMTIMELRSTAEVLKETDEEEAGNVEGGEVDSGTSDKLPTPVMDKFGKAVPEVTTAPAVILEDDSKSARAAKILSEMESDLHELEVREKRAETENAIVTPEVTPVVGTVTAEINPEDFGKALDPEEALIQQCDALADDGVITVPMYKRLVKLSSEWKTLIAPDNRSTLADYSTVTSEDTAIKESTKVADIATVIDKTMLKSSLADFDKKYIEEVLPRDIAAMVVNIQKAGYAISKYDVETREDYLGSFEMHSIRLNPFEGVPSTLRSKLPKVDKDGVYVSNGVKYRLRKQRGDAPIRKVAPDRVALTTYYGKTFVNRSSKKVNSYASWLCNNVMFKGIDHQDNDITNLAPANVFDNHFKCPRTYSTLAMSFKGLTAGGWDFVFDHRVREKIWTPEELDKLEVNGRVAVATNGFNESLTMDVNGVLYADKPEGEVLVGPIESVFKIPSSDVPVEFSETKVFGKEIPTGVILGYLLGFDNLMKMLKVTPRRVPAGQRIGLQDQEYAIVFSDETLIFDRDDKLAAMVLAGFRSLEKVTRIHPSHIFNKTGVYLNLLESMGIGARYLREIDLMDKLFIDPISLELLKEMKEPTSFRGLLVRGSQLLLEDRHPDALDMNYMRIKGYERLAGAMYAELVQGIRDHKAKGGRSTAPVELHPYAVWKRVAQDPSINLVSDINPVQNLKEMEAVTFSGVGGRSSRSMVKGTRRYHKNDMGVISEGTVDSSDVGINTYLSADPQFTSLRGTSKRYEMGKTGVTALLSTSALLSPGSDRDDPKRVYENLLRPVEILDCNFFN